MESLVIQIVTEIFVTVSSAIIVYFALKKFDDGSKSLK